MRVPVFPIVASLALLAAPAFAQNGAMTGTTGDQNGTTGAYNSQGAHNSWTKGANVTPNTRERIRQSLMQSGFRDVKVTPEAFVIHAMAPDGSHIVMLLRPDELTGVIESGSSGNGGTGNSANGGNNGGASTNNGGDNNGGAAKQ